MSGSNGPPRRFRVDRVASVLAEFEALIREAQENGQAVAFAGAMKRIMAGLRARARDLGEPLWTLHHAHLEVRLVADGPVRRPPNRLRGRHPEGVSDVSGRVRFSDPTS